MTIYDAVNKYNYISIDFDGVLIEHFLNKSYARKMERNISMPTNHLIIKLEIVFIKLINIFKKPLPGMVDVIKRLDDEGKTLHLISSRNVTFSTATLEWLRKNKIDSYFIEMEFNEHPITAVEYKLMKYNEIQPEIHVDDNYETIEALAKKYPNKPFVYFDYTGKKETFDLPNVINTTKWA